MAAQMSARGATAEGGSRARLPSLPPVARRDEGAVVAGICSGVAHALGVDPTGVRAVFAILALSGGSGIVLYLGAWLFLAPPDAPERARGGLARGAGIALFVLASFLLLRGLGLAASLLVPAALAAPPRARSAASGGARNSHVPR